MCLLPVTSKIFGIQDGYFSSSVGTVSCNYSFWLLMWLLKDYSYIQR